MITDRDSPMERLVSLQCLKDIAVYQMQVLIVSPRGRQELAPKIKEQLDLINYLVNEINKLLPKNEE